MVSGPLFVVTWSTRRVVVGQLTGGQKLFSRSEPRPRSTNNGPLTNLFRLLEQPPDDLLGVDSFGLGGERGDDAVRQDRDGGFLDVFEPHHVTAEQGRAGLGTEDQVLDRTRAGSPGDQRLDPRRGRRAVRAGSSAPAGPRRNRCGRAPARDAPGSGA